MTVEGHHEAAEADVAAALGDLEALLGRHAGGAVQARLLSSACPEFREK
ncbi:MAG: hypothetical protein AB1578_23785 [Thermodesulfobacteriota bacterium]